jgi:hypothetical protein
MAQKIKAGDVPPGVMKAYYMKVIDSLPTTWEKQNEYYTAHFTKSKLKASMIFKESAEWIWTRWEIASKYLPKMIKAYVATNYPTFKPYKSIIEYKPGGEFYLVRLKQKTEILELRFSTKPEFIGIEPSNASNPKDTKAPENSNKDK